MLILPDLQQANLGAYPHRPLVTDRDVAPVARLWLLVDDATPAVVPPVLMAEAVQLLLAGKGIVILARRPEPEVDVRTGLMHAVTVNLIVTYPTYAPEVGTLAILGSGSLPVGQQPGDCRKFYTAVDQQSRSTSIARAGS